MVMSNTKKAQYFLNLIILTSTYKEIASFIFVINSSTVSPVE